MTDDVSTKPIYDRIHIGDAFLPYEYVVTGEMLDDYRRTVGNPKAAYPTVAGRHSLRAWTNRFGEGTLANVGAESEYFNPVLPDKRIFVEAKVVDKYIRRGKPFVVIDSSAVDEDGRLIEKSRLIGLAPTGHDPLFAEVKKKWGTK